MALKAVAYDDVTDRFKKLAVGSPDLRAGRDTVTVSTTSLAVTFSSVLPNTSYAILCTWQNTTDSTPQFQPLNVVALSVSGFTVKWNVPVDTGNYLINWQATAFS